MEYNNLSVSTYIINLEERKERLENVLKEFTSKPEFDVSVIAAERGATGAEGLWKSFQKVIRLAKERDDDVIVICEDDHQFTKEYNKEYLFRNIIEAHEQGCEILCGGISGNFDRILLPISQNRFWISEYWCNQFIVIYKSLFEKIQNHKFELTSKVDLTISGITDKKMFLFPFISTQKIYDYSDVTIRNGHDKNWSQNRFSYATERLVLMQKVFNYYNTYDRPL